MLDPIQDVPLKLHQIPRSDIRNLAQPNWVPPLRLTPEEQSVVEKDGTVLLLGRSGTGKTLCIANRIVLARESHGNTPDFRQLFVARSKKICRHVHRLVGDKVAEDEKENGAGGTCDYVSFSKLLSDCCGKVGVEHSQRNRVGYQRYKREFHRETRDDQLDPLVIWAQINNFIKGSIQAVQKGGPLSEEEYMTLGEKQCRLNLDQRKVAYQRFGKLSWGCVVGQALSYFETHKIAVFPKSTTSSSWIQADCGTTAIGAVCCFEH